MRLIWWLITVGAVGLTSIILSEAGTLDPVQNISLTASAPLEAVLRDAGGSLDDVFLSIKDRGDLKRENERLREQIEELQAQIADQQGAEQRIAELEEALGVKQSRPEDQLLAANVIAEEPSGLKRMIAIDQGQADGVDEGMVVLSRNGSLVGTVARSFDDFAWIRLITDPSSSVNAQVNVEAAGGPSATPGPAGAPTPSPESSPAPQAVRGVAEGDLREGIILDLLPPEAQIVSGAFVVTSGLGGNYPQGILLGTVDEVEQRPQSAFKRATVIPASQLRELETVLVLMNFKPARLTPP